MNDRHNAYDFCVPIGSPALAMAPSSFSKTDIQNGVNLEFAIKEGGINVQFGHLMENSFSYTQGSQFLRGQQIALTGNTGDVDPIYGVIEQLHFMVFTSENGRPIDPFRNITGVDYPMGSRISLWSVDNLMVDPIPGVQ